MIILYFGLLITVELMNTLLRWLTAMISNLTSAVARSISVYSSGLKRLTVKCLKCSSELVPAIYLFDILIFSYGLILFSFFWLYFVQISSSIAHSNFECLILLFL